VRGRARTQRRRSDTAHGCGRYVRHCPHNVIHTCLLADAARNENDPPTENDRPISGGCADCGQLEIVEELLRHGAAEAGAGGQRDGIHSRDCNGCSALDFARDQVGACLQPCHDRIMERPLA
jgi:ferredoxin